MLFLQICVSSGNHWAVNQRDKLSGLFLILFQFRTRFLKIPFLKRRTTTLSLYILVTVDGIFVLVFHWQATIMGPVWMLFFLFSWNIISREYNLLFL